MDKRKRLIASSIKYKGDWLSIYNDIIKHESIEEEYLQAADELKCKVITLMDEDYPIQLKTVHRPPFVLYYYGDITWTHDYLKNVSVVGSRVFSEYGERKTKEIVGELVKKDYTIVSGLAMGIDAIAHQTAIESGGRTIAILGSGIDYCYPSTNKDLYEYIKQKHLLISEYPGFTEPMPFLFPIRNRIIAGLSKTIVIPEAKRKSGTMITACLALKGDADVMCVPAEADTESGCNMLIKHGAYLVENVNDVLDFMSKF